MHAAPNIMTSNNNLQECTMQHSIHCMTVYVIGNTLQKYSSRTTNISDIIIPVLHFVDKNCADSLQQATQHHHSSAYHYNTPVAFPHSLLQSQPSDTTTTHSTDSNGRWLPSTADLFLFALRRKQVKLFMRRNFGRLFALRSLYPSQGITKSNMRIKKNLSERS